MEITIDKNCRYSKTHEWVTVSAGKASCGITDYAQSQLSDIVHVELPEVGDTFKQGEVFASVESVKAASDCYMPLSGEIIEVNETLSNRPEIVNQDPYSEGWFIRFKPEDLSELENLMKPDEYEEYIKSLE
jgi:glycine cleavage system H protein